MGVDGVDGGVVNQPDVFDGGVGNGAFDRPVAGGASRPRQTPSSSTESPTISTIPFSSGSGSTSWV